jgi:replication factor A1
VLAHVIAISPKEVTIRGEPRQIYYGILGDESGTISFTSWDDLNVEKGDVIEIANAYTKEWQGAVQLNMSERSHIEKRERSSLPDEAFEPRKCSIQELRSGMGAVDVTGSIMEVESREVAVDDAKKQVFSGVIGDTTGKIQFTAWHDFKLIPEETYQISGGYVKGWKGLPQLSFDENATVKLLKKKKIDTDEVPVPLIPLFKVVEGPGRFNVKIQGTVIDVLPGSGFILRCPECNRMLLNGECRTHGPQEGIPDLRIKCIVDDGNGSVNAVLNRETCEHLLKKTLEDCKEMTPQALNHDIVNTLFAHLILLKGNALNDSFGTTFVVEEAEMVEVDVKEKAGILSDGLEELE